jgi:multidrug efflux pump subunit AcrB
MTGFIAWRTSRISAGVTWTRREPMFRFNGQQAIGLAIAMQMGGNIQEFGKATAPAHG